MAATMTTAPSDTYSTEPKIYISHATLELKVTKGDYVWHTDVLTPPQTPAAKETEVAKKHISEANSAAAAAVATAAIGGAAAGVAQNATHSKPAVKPVSLPKAVTNFMEAERYHTECIQNMGQVLISKV